VAGVPLWSRLARHARAGAALAGINAAVVGILAAALYDPVWITAVRSGADVAIAVAGVLCLERWRVPPAAVVALCVAVSVGLEAFG
jgi:chromate transporter